MKIEYKGVMYKSFSELCEKETTVHRTTVRHRLSKGWSLEDALNNWRFNCNVWKDHKGQTFNSLKKMLKNYNVSPKTFSWRLNAGWDLEKALTFNKGEKNGF